MTSEFRKIQEKAKELKPENKKFLGKLKQKPPKQLDITMQQLHAEVFENTDCLSCANCCKTTVPIITDRDSERISKFLKMKIFDFETEFVNIEVNGSKSFKTAPCRFLSEDNYCLIYEVRPKACSEFPHTDRKRFHQISKITLENTIVCPAASLIIEKLKLQLQNNSKPQKRKKG